MLRGFSTRWVFPILLLFFFTTTHAARILSPPDLNTVVFDAPPPSWLSPNQTLVSGPLCRWEREEAPETISRMKDCIAITSDYNVPNLIRRLVSVGALGLILRDTISAYPGTYDLPYLPTREFDNFTVVQIGSGDTYKLWAWLEQYNKTSQQIIVEIGGYPPDKNLWLEVRSSPVWYAVQALMSIFCFTALIMALYKLVRFLRWRGFEGGVPQICLFFETLGNLFRVLYWAIDPIFLMRGAWSYAVSNILLSIHVPMFVASTLCLSLHWHEILSQATVAVPLGLSKFKWSFVVIVVVLFILEFISAGLRALDNEIFALVVISAVIALIVTIGTSAFFLVTASRVVQFLSRDAQDLTSAERRSPIVRKTVRIVVASAVFEILFAVAVVLIAVPDLFYDPRAFHTLLTIKDVFLSCISFTQIMAFKPPRGLPRGATGTGATVTTDSTTSKRGMRSNELSAIRSDTVTTPASSTSSSDDEGSEESSEEESDEGDDSYTSSSSLPPASSSEVSKQPSSSSSSKAAVVPDTEGDAANEDSAPRSSSSSSERKKETVKVKSVTVVEVEKKKSRQKPLKKQKKPEHEPELESESESTDAKDDGPDSSDTGSSLESSAQSAEEPVKPKKSMRKTKTAKKASAKKAAAQKPKKKKAAKSAGAKKKRSSPSDE